MSEREKEILTNIGRALPNMSEFDKGYLLGIAEANVNQRKEEKDGGGRDKRQTI